MKFYRVSCRTERDNHFGYSFYMSKADAEKKVRDFEADCSPEDGVSTEIEVVIVRLNKSGILAALNTYAGHPDNG